MARALLAAALLATAQAMVGRVQAAEAAMRAAAGASCVATSAAGPIATRGMSLDKMAPLAEKRSSPIPVASGVPALGAYMAFERNIIAAIAAPIPSMATSAGGYLVRSRLRLAELQAVPTLRIQAAARGYLVRSMLRLAELRAALNGTALSTVVWLRTVYGRLNDLAIFARAVGGKSVSMGTLLHRYGKAKKASSAKKQRADARRSRPRPPANTSSQMALSTQWGGATRTP